MTAQLGLALKAAGQATVALHNDDWLALVRAEARRIATREDRPVTTDDLHAFCDRNGIVPRHRNAWGVVFAGEEWYCAGFKATERPEARGRILRMWRLRTQPAGRNGR